MKTTMGALLAMTAAVSSVGCAYQHIRCTDKGGNGTITAEYTYPEDGFESDGVFRVGFDRHGDPYPDPREVAIDDARLESCHSALREYFAGTGYDAASVAAAFGRRISTACGKRTLIILIHGINSSYPESRRSYESARASIQKQFPQLDAVFLEIYWDGMWGDAISLWPHARETSKWVGLRLRPLLSALDPAIPVRVVTHSRGSAVIASALWNVKLGESDASGREFTALQQKGPIPANRDLRIGLVAPAMGEEEFEGFNVRGASEGSVIIAVNETDETLAKGMVPAGWFGSTRLGCCLDAFRAVERMLNRDHAVAKLVDLSGSSVHDFKDYVWRREFKGKFLHLLFAPAAAVAASRP